MPARLSRDDSQSCMLYRMADPIITEEQGQRIWEAISTWQTIYTQEKGKPPEFTWANLSKSCLLGRLIYEGKPPLPIPPPRFWAAPWYALVEDGCAWLWSHDVSRLTGDLGQTRLNIGGDIDWHVDRVITEPDTEPILGGIRRWCGEFILVYPRNGRWVLRYVTNNDEPPVGGRSIDPMLGYTYGNPIDLRYDMKLVRLDDE